MATPATIITGSHRSSQPTLDLDAGTDLPIIARFALAALLIGTVVLLVVAASSSPRSGAGALKPSRPATTMMPVIHTAWTPSARSLERDEPRGPITSRQEIATLDAAVSVTSVGPTQPTGFTDVQHH